MDIRTQIKDIVEKAIQEKVFPGCVVGIVWKSGERIILPFGKFTYEADAALVKEDTLYDLASITKSLPTNSIALQLIDQGKLSLDDKLIQYVPELINAEREEVLIRHLLTYTLQGYGVAYLYNEGLESFYKTLFTRDFGAKPGSVFEYSNIPAIFLALVLERITGKTLDILAQELFFDPLKMQRTTFFPEHFLKEEIVPTEINDWRGLVHGEVHDESAFLLKKENIIAGHAGLFSCASDLLNFMEMLLHNGEWKGKKYFSESILEQIETNQIPELNDFTGLGWELNQARYMGKNCSQNTFGKTGFTGTLCVGDRKKGVAYVILSNRTYPQRQKDSSAMNGLRKAIGEIIL